MASRIWDLCKADVGPKEVMIMVVVQPPRRVARATLVVQAIQCLATVARAIAEWIDLLNQ